MRERKGMRLRAAGRCDGRETWIIWWCLFAAGTILCSQGALLFSYVSFSRTVSNMGETNDDDIDEPFPFLRPGETRT